MNRIELVGQPDGLTVWNVTNKIPLVGDGRVGDRHRRDHPAAGQASRKDVAPGSEFGAVLAHLRDHYHTRSPNRQLARLAHMSVRAFEREFPRQLSHHASEISFASSRCGWPAGPWFTRASRSRRWHLAAGSPTKATSHVNFAVILAERLVIIASITPGEPPLPPLIQIRLFNHKPVPGR